MQSTQAEWAQRQRSARRKEEHDKHMGKGIQDARTRNTGACNEQQVEAIRESGARQEVPVTVTSKIKQEANKRDW